MLPERERAALAALSVHPGVRINRYFALMVNTPVRPAQFCDVPPGGLEPAPGQLRANRTELNRIKCMLSANWVER